MKKKELILVTTYCPTKEKKETLLKLLKSLEKYRDKYSILVTSHTTIDSFFFNYFDYFYYDKNNEILTDIEYRQNGWFIPFKDYVIWSSYINIGNSLKAIWDLLIPSISIAKSCNYEKIHHIEYDSEIIDDFELIENSKLLDDYDYIIYNSENTHKLVGAFFSFKTNSVIDEHLINTPSTYEKLFFDSYPKVPENVFFELIKNQRKYYSKDFNLLINNGIILNKVNSPISWNVPFYDEKDKKLKFISHNKSNIDFEIKVIIDGRLCNIGLVKCNHWKIIELDNNFINVKNLVVFKDNIKILEIDFTVKGYKERFIKYNSVLNLKSLNM